MRARSKSWARRGGIAALAAGAVVLGTRPADALPPGPLGTEAPVLVYDAGAGAATSSIAAPTNYLIQGDFNLDGFPDVVNVTRLGAQVFLNNGFTGGSLDLQLAQEFAAPYSYGGGAVDADGDGDLDLVLPDLSHVYLGTNDGTGHFDFTTIVTHGFGSSTVAVPFTAVAAGTPIEDHYPDDFESYDPGSFVAPVGLWTGQWSADVGIGAPENGAWRITTDPVDPASGKFLHMFSPDSGGRNHWVAFRADSTSGPLTGATVSFDYNLVEDSDLRIYVSESSATDRSTQVPFNFVEEPSADLAVQTSAVAYVNRWQSTGITLTAGDGFSIEASGSVFDLGALAGPFGPDGDPGVVNGTTGIANQYGLIGRIGGGAPFFVGADFDGVAGATGLLELSVNEGHGAPDAWADNIGFFDAHVVVTNSAITKSTGTIDLASYLSGTSTTLYVILDGTSDHDETRIRVDDWHLDVTYPTSSLTAAQNLRIALCPAADEVVSDLIDPSNTGRLPYLYVLERDGVTWELFQRLDKIHCDGVAARDMDADGDVDLLACHRSNAMAAAAFFPYRSHAADGTPADPYTPIAGLTATHPYPWSFTPTIADDGDLAVGGWHSASVYDRFGGVWGASTFVSMNETGGSGLPTGELVGLAFSDMDLDGSGDLVLLGMNTPLVLAKRSGDPNAPANRFTSLPIAGQQKDLAVANWDTDLGGSPDVIVGGTHGLWFLQNVNRDTPGSPVLPPVTPAYTNLLTALLEVRDLLDPFRAPPLSDDEARVLAAIAQLHLTSIDLDYLRTGALEGATNPDKVEFLRDVYGLALTANGFLSSAKFEALANGEIDDVASIETIQDRIADALTYITDQAFALGGIVPKAAPGRQVRRLLNLARRDRDLARELLAAARNSDDVRESDRLLRQSMGTSRRAFQRLVAYWKRTGQL